MGDKLGVALSVKDLFNGRKLIEKHQSVGSESEDRLVEEKDIELSQLSKYITSFINMQG